MIRSRRNGIGLSGWQRSVPPVALLLWGCLWLNLNTGFWHIKAPHSADDWQLLIRALLPFAVLPVAAVLLFHQWNPGPLRFSPTGFLAIYGFLAAVASLYSPEPWWAAYWSVAFLATIAAALTFGLRQNPVRSSRQMLQVTWAVTFVVAAIIAYMTRGLVFGEAQSAYNVNIEVDELTRASGAARWAAVPGLVCLIRAYHSRRSVLVAPYLAAAGAAFFIVYRMQSRGAILGSAAALLFAVFTATRMRRYALPFLILAAAILAILETPSLLSGRISEYLMRGQTEEEFRSMTGRTRAYDLGLSAIQESPVLGRGQWADRIIIGEHVHNSYLQALLNAGILGGVPYFGSWIAGWVLFFRLQKRSHALRPEDRTALLEAGTVMMFFTVRSIPETTTASFAVDLLVMAAVYVYLESLYGAVEGGAPSSQKRPPARITRRIPVLVSRGGQARRPVEIA